MIEIVWEFDVKDEARSQFELAFGPGGAWSQLFARQPGFRGVTVLRETTDARRYLVIEIWDSAALRDQALAGREAQYTALDAQLGSWIDAKTELGVFRLLAEATVRPLPTAGRATSRESYRAR